MDQYFSIFIISLLEAKDRRHKLIGQLRDMGLDMEVIPAHDGHREDFPFRDYRRWVTGFWWDKEEFKPGAFACFLSHVECWKRVVTEGLPYVVILEDDAVLEPVGFIQLLEDLRGIQFDLMFVNDGMRGLMDNVTGFSTDSSSNWDTGQVLIDVLENGKYSKSFTPGSFGYIVSLGGAKKLLEVLERDGICMGVDYAMLFGALNCNEVAKIRSLRSIPDYLRIYLNNIEDSAAPAEARVVIKSVVYTGMPVSHDYSYGSSIKHERFSPFDVFWGERTSREGLLKKLLRSMWGGSWWRFGR
jgi:GR25 family glycosyltransferase involved in LPS biosynthesis